MTDQEIVAGRGDIAQASGTLGLNVYADFEYISVLQTYASYPDVGQGSGAVAWLAGSFFGGNDAIAQLWDNNGSLGLNIYGGSFATAFEAAAFSFPDLGQGSGAMAWLTGDFTGSGLTEIAQLWNNGGNLGLNLYRMGSDPVRPIFPETVISSSDLGQGSGAVAWLTGDFTGSGHTEIAQLWDNGGNLAVNIYGMAGGNVTVHYSSDLGQGVGAVAWLTGDFTGSGHTEIAQLWDNNGTAALIVYGFPNATTETLISSDLGQGVGAVAWLTGDFTGSGRTEIAQLWDNNGTLGAVIYGCVNGTAETLFGSSDLGQGSGAVAWLTGNFISSGTTEVVQLWDNQGTLSWLLYTFSGGNLQGDWFEGGLGQGPGALAWLTGNFTGSGLTAIAQPWAS
jgi:hypothetical protein